MVQADIDLTQAAAELIDAFNEGRLGALPGTAGA